ncbi:MAG: hypothetical protein ACPL3A_02595 [Thermoanaerobacteraceae bacterium]
MKLNSKIIGIILLLLLFGGIGIAEATNYWKTESSKVPATYIDGEFAGEYNPADIRGSYTFNDINKFFKIPIDELAQAFGINTSDKASFKINQLETVYQYLKDNGTEIGVSSVRLFVSLYNGLPYDLSNDIYLPQSAVEILKAKDTLTEEQIKYLENHTVNIQNQSEYVKTESNITENLTDRTIKGNTTFKEIINWGISKEEIEAILNKKIQNTASKIKDYCLENNIDFETIKNELQNKLNTLK